MSKQALQMVKQTMMGHNNRSEWPGCFSFLFLALFLWVCISFSQLEADESEDYASRFMLRQNNSQQCLAIRESSNDPGDCFPGSDGKTMVCYKANEAALETCDDNEWLQKWVFDFQKKRIHSDSYASSLCLTRQDQTLSMAPCKPGNLKQAWYFNHQEILNSRVDFLEKYGYVKLIKNLGQIKEPLSSLFSEPEMGDDFCYKSPFTGRVECGSTLFSDTDFAQRVVEQDFLLKSDSGCLTLGSPDDDEYVCPVASEVDEAICSGNTMVTLQSCIEHEKSQGWRFDFSKKRLYFLADKKHYCLTRGGATSGLLPCEDSDTQWVFNQDRALGYKLEGQDNIELLNLVDQETRRDQKPFRFQMFGSENGYHPCYRSPVTGKVNCGSAPASQDSWAPSSAWSWVSKKLTEDLFIINRSEGTCLSVQSCSPGDSGRYDCYGGTAVKMKSCQGISDQIWKHDLVTKRLFSKKAGEHFCLSWRSEQLTLEHCLPGGASSQQWYFARGKGYGSAEWGMLRFFAHGLKDPYPYLKGLLPPGQYDSRHDRAALPALKIEYEPLYWSEEGEDCGFHPVTGAEGKRCFK